MNEKYSVFEVPFLPGESNLYCENLMDNSSGLTLTLSENKPGRVLKINFKHVYSYSKTNESYRLKTHDKIPHAQYLMLKVEN